jgi:hypothetical protein
MSVLITVNGDHCLSRSKSKVLRLIKCNVLNNDQLLDDNIKWKLIPRHSRTHAYNIVVPKEPSNCIDISGSNDPILEIYECGNMQNNQLFSFKNGIMKSFINEDSCVNIKDDGDDENRKKSLASKKNSIKLLWSTTCDTKNAKIGFIAIDRNINNNSRDLKMNNVGISISMSTSLKKAIVDSDDRMKMLRDVMIHPNHPFANKIKHSPSSFYLSPTFLCVCFIIIIWMIREMFGLKNDSKTATYKKSIRKRRYQ